MEPVSVVIITKNEGRNIAACVGAARLLTNDVVVVDSGSTDNTVSLARNAGAVVIETEWLGYGAARNTAAAHAVNDWILAVDADERVTKGLAEVIRGLQAGSGKTAFGFKRQNFYLGKKIRFGEWGRDKVYRLYNRNYVQWDLSPVHEVLVGQEAKELVPGASLHHFSITDPIQNKIKTEKYARLNAEKLAQSGRQAGWAKRYLSPAFNFFRMYILLLGFLDGRAGFEIAVATTRYVWLKYHLLHQLNKAQGRG